MKPTTAQIAVTVSIILALIAGFISTGKMIQSVEDLRADVGSLTKEIRDLNRRLGDNREDILKLKLWREFLERLGDENVTEDTPE